MTAADTLAHVEDVIRAHRSFEETAKSTHAVGQSQTRIIDEIERVIERWRTLGEDARR